MTIYCLPEVLLAAWACCLLLAEAVFRVPPGRVGVWAIGGLALAAVAVAALPTNGIALSGWSGAFVWDGLAKFFKLLMLGATGGAIAMGLPRRAASPQGIAHSIAEFRGEFLILPLFAACGLLALASAGDFFVLFAGLELVTITSYILVAYQRHNFKSLEAGVKYLILGALSTAFLVLGIAYIYGAVGALRFDAIQAITAQAGLTPALALGLVLVIAGIGFKIAAVPFHWWAPDVYEGAPTPVTAFLATASKAAGFIVLVRVLNNAFGAEAAVELWSRLLYGIAVASLVLGNLAAIGQRRLKRMLAYSSIGHTGYLLISIVVNSPLGLSALCTYLGAYVPASLAAFWVIERLAPQLGGDDIYRWAGLHRRQPLAAAALLLALLSLAGIPPLVGFIAKLSSLAAAWEAGLYGLTFVGIGGALAGLFYYLNVVRTLYWSEPAEATKLSLGTWDSAVLVILSALLVVGGVIPGWLARVLENLCTRL